VIIKRFEEGLVKVICNVGVLVAGFDSDVRCVIYARPTKSEMRWIQCLGRGLRTADGKDKCLIFDHSGTVHRLGFPDHIEYDELPRKDDGMSEQQREIKEREKKEKLPKECPKCKYMKPAGVFQCPKCGMKPRAGEDVEVDRSRKLESLTSEKKVWTHEDKQKLYSELVGYQKEREMKGKPISDGWISHKYREKTGVWPKNMHRSPRVPSPETRRWIQHQNIKFAKGRKKGQATLNDLKRVFDENN
jgi:ribosomal protein L37AE/L43A